MLKAVSLRAELTLVYSVYGTIFCRRRTLLGVLRYSDGGGWALVTPLENITFFNSSEFYDNTG